MLNLACVMHDDAVEAIAADYIEGAMRAFEILNG